MTRSIRWRSVLLGFAVAALLAIGLGLLGGWTGAALNPGFGPAMQFVSMLVGGFVAGRSAGRLGLMQGLAVAVIFILVGVSYTAWFEIDLVGRYGPQVLRPMDSTSMILTDLVHLIGGTMGGWLAETTTRSNE